MIIHTGLRTDIPAFYTPWLLRRLEEGYALVRDPHRPGLITRYTLDPAVVDLIAFCTKNPAPMLPHLSALAPYGQHWFVTITPYGEDMEPHVPPADRVMADFIALSERLGPHRVAWRYDPILLTPRCTPAWHAAQFHRMARRLRGATDTCVISFIDLYSKVRRNAPELEEVPPPQRLELGRILCGIARDNGMTLKACAEGDLLAPLGVDCSGCMSAETYRRAFGEGLRIPRISAGRKECACHLSCDIGAYNTCGHLCRYCYANASPALVRRAMAEHDPASPLLSGHVQPGDHIRQARQESWRDGQIRLEELLTSTQERQS